MSKTYTDRDGNQWKHGAIREDGFIFRGISKSGMPTFISPEAYTRNIEGNKRRSGVSKTRARRKERTVAATKSFVSERIKREALALHARGKDAVTIAMRLSIPVSTVCEICAPNPTL